MYNLVILLSLVLSVVAQTTSPCLSSGDETTINQLFSSGGAGTVVQICPNTFIIISNTISFTAPDQELSTYGYPTDASRATIQIAASPANSVSTLVFGRSLSGVRLLNIVLDGNRPNTGLITTGDANVELGGGGNGQIVSFVGSKNPRAWSCMHLFESTNNQDCTNVTVSNNDIGPCGTQTNWADGISFSCIQSVVSNNVIDGPTDGGIVLFGAPGTLVTGNTIIGSPTDRGWGAINLVDSGAGYNGNFAGVVVTQNTITAGKMFNIGIAIGSNVWSDDAGGFKLTGPTSVTNNYFSGNIAFPIALNGWQNGITATGNTDSGVVKPNSDFAEDYSCSAGTATVFASNALWSYWSPGVSGSADLQGDFVDAAGGGEPTYYLCATPSLPNSVTFNAGSLTLGSSQGQFVRLHGGIVVQYQGDNNIVIGDISRPGTFNVLWASGHTVPSCTPSGQDLCQMAFQGDGNLVTYFNGEAEFSTETNPQGAQLVYINQAPWMQILDSTGSVIWDTTRAS